MLYVTGALNPEGAQLGVTKTGETFARASSYTITASDAARFKNANPAYVVRLTDNVLKLVDLFSVTVAQGIEHGTVTTSVSNATGGDIVALTLTPEEGYVVESVSVNDTAPSPQPKRPMPR